MPLYMCVFVGVGEGGGVVSVALQEETAVALCSFFSVSLTVGVWLWKSLSGNQVHDSCSARGQLQSSQGNVAMKESSLEDEAQYAGAADTLLFPPCGPIVKDMLGDICGRVVRGESEVLRFPTDQDKAEVHHINVPLAGHGSVRREAE